MGVSAPKGALTFQVVSSGDYNFFDNLALLHQIRYVSPLEVFKAFSA